MSVYNTNFNIYRLGKDGQLKLHYTSINNSCFANYTGGMNFNTLDIFEVYYCFDKLQNEEAAQWWIDCLNEIGFKVEQTIKKRSEYKETDLPLKLIASEFYVWTINSKDYKNKRQLMMCLHLLREFFGYGNPQSIVNAYEIWKKHNKILSKFNSFLYSCFLKGGTQDHLYWSQTIVYKFFTNKEINKFVNKITNQTNISSGFVDNFKIYTLKPHPYGNRYPDLKQEVKSKECSLEDYLLKLKEL